MMVLHPVTPMNPPDDAPGKKEQVRRMFDAIARRYDFLNGFLSLGVDKAWRRQAIRTLQDVRPKRILDMATGTGALAIEALWLEPVTVLGIDLSEEMLARGREKLKRLPGGARIRLEQGDSEKTGLASGSFDAVTVAFGVRNFEDLDAGLMEMYRVLVPGGRAVVLEFARPEKFPVKQLYHFYFHKILPFFGKIISRDPEAYAYLPRSVSVFPFGEAFLERMRAAGFTDTKCRYLSFGIAALYTGRKQQ